MSRYITPIDEPNEQVMNVLSRIEGSLIDLYVMVQDLKTKNDQLETQLNTLVNNAQSASTEDPTPENTEPPAEDPAPENTEPPAQE